MKYLTFAIVTVGLLASASTAIAVETHCKGDALKEQPPVPNYPHHVRNVVWHNMRAMCLQELSRTTKPQINSNTTSTPPASSPASSK